MKKTFIIAILCITGLTNQSFAKSPIKTITKKAKTVVTAATAKVVTTPVTDTDNVSGLKSSLTVGIEKAVAKLGAENGFFNDSIFKLNLPPDAKAISNNIKFIPGGKDLVNKTILALNRTAEDAVKDAAPIFTAAITSMSIPDALSILFGKDDAATSYLRQKTFTELQAAFSPKVKASLAKPMMAGVSTTQTWNTLSSTYNAAANSTAGKFAKLKSVNVNLENYVTEQALNALFAKIADQEKAFRKDPKARTSDLLKKVFGQLDKK